MSIGTMIEGKKYRLFTEHLKTFFTRENGKVVIKDVNYRGTFIIC